MQNRKLLLPGIILVLGIVLLAGWLSFHSFEEFYAANSTPHTSSGFPGFTYVGPGCMVEFQGRYSLYLPRGWYSYTDEHYIDLRNYDAAKIQYVHGAPLNMPDDAIHVQMYTIQLERGQTLGDRMRQVVSTINPFLQPEFIEYDWGQVKALGWKTAAADDQLLLEIYPGQGDWIISALVLDVPDAVLPRLFAVLARLKVPADCPGWPAMKTSLTAASIPYPLPTLLSYPLPAITASPLSEPYPSMQRQSQPTTTAAPYPLPTNDEGSYIPQYTLLPTRQYDSYFGITDIYFLDRQLGYAVGISRTLQANTGAVAVRVTHDGGQNWQPAGKIQGWKAEGPMLVKRIRFLSPELGFAFDPGLLTTQDGGKTWQESGFGPGELKNGDETGDEVISLEMSGRAAWAIHQICPTRETCTLELLSYQDQSGWQPAAVQPPLLGWQAQVVFRNEQQVWILYCDYGLQTGYHLITTQDGGETWVEASMPNNERKRWNRFLLAVNPQGDLWLLHIGIGATSMSDKQLFISKDGGLTWELQARTYFRKETIITGLLPATGHPSSMSVVSDQRAFLAESSWGAVLATYDGGLSWSHPIPYGPLIGVVGIGQVFFVDENYGWACTQYYVFRTTDGGLSWTVFQIP